MFSIILKSIKVSFVFLLLAASIAAAGQIDEGDIPEPCVVCTGVALEYADADTCWPGGIVSVPVLVTNSDTLEYLQIWAVCPTGFTYIEFDSEGTPWSDSIIDLSSGSTVEIHLADEGTLPPDTSERVIDLKFEVSDSYSFDTSFTIKFGHNIVATIKGDLYDCDVTDTTWGTVTIPDDSVVVTFDSVLAYSYQAADNSDQAKLDNPLKVPVKLYTNFPCSTYVIWFDVPDSLNYIGLDTLIAGVQVTRYGVTDSLKIHGTLPSKPGNDSTYYLCDLKFEVGNFKYRYDASQTFDTTLYLGFPASGVIPPWTHVRNWGTNDAVTYGSISKVSEGIYLPKYEVFLDIKDAEVDMCGEVEVPVACSTTFWAQYNNLYIAYDYRYLTYTGIDSTGGYIPPIHEDDVKDTSGYLEIRQFTTGDPSDSGKYILPNLEQTLFKIKFDATENFDFGQNTTVQVFDSTWTPPNLFYDFFSPDGANNKIARDQDDTQVWSTSNGTVSNPAEFRVSAGGPTYYANEVVRLEINVEYVNVDSVTDCILSYTEETTVADSVTPGDWEFKDFEYQPEWLYFCFGEEYGYPDTAGLLAYVWLTWADTGCFEIVEGEDSWVHFPGGDIEVQVVGDPIHYKWQQPKLATGLPDVFTLSQNYPNPFNAQTNISFNMPKPGMAELKVFDILGRQITTLVSEELPAGEHIINWDGANAAGKPIAGGVYFYVLKAGDFREAKKMLYLK